MAMAAKKSRAENNSPAKTSGSTRKVEEVDFFDYLRTKKGRRYVEEIGVADYLKKKRQSATP
jgi:hypothetical protein